MKTKIWKLLIWIAVILPASLLSARTADANTLVVDGAGIFSTDEVSQIQDSCDDILNRYDTSVYIITTKNFKEKEKDSSYMDSIAEDKNAPQNLIVLFINLKKETPVCNIYAYGKAKNMLTDKRCKKMLRHITRKVSKQNYLPAVNTFCSEALIYMGRKPMLDSAPFSSLLHLTLCVLFACFILYSILHKLPDKTPENAKTYLDPQSSSISGQSDLFTHLTEERVPKSKHSSEMSSNA